MAEQMRVDEFLSSLLGICHPLEPLDLPLLDAHGATLAEDIYAGVEFEAGSPEADAMVKVLQEQFGVTQIRFPENVGLGVKPISKQGTERLVKQAIDYAIKNNRTSNSSPI